MHGNMPHSGVNFVPSSPPLFAVFFPNSGSSAGVDVTFCAAVLSAALSDRPLHVDQQQPAFLLTQHVSSQPSGSKIDGSVQIQHVPEYCAVSHSTRKRVKQSTVDALVEVLVLVLVDVLVLVLVLVLVDVVVSVVSNT